MITKKKGIFIFGILLLIISLPLIFGQEKEFDYVISNSEKWQDVYSTMIYSKYNNVEDDFLVSTPHGDIILNNINRQNRIRVISSKSNPFVFNYQSTIKLKGFAEPSEIEVDNANLDLIEELPDINNFIIVGDSYGFNSIAVAPYAIITNSWVFLSNKINIYEIDEILSRRNVDKIIIYGYVDKVVRDTIEKYNPEYIDNGDKFKDNIDIVKKYIKIRPAKQVAFTNGEFIEKELLNGNEPVLFTGKENVPEQIQEYLKSSDIEVGVLVGNDLVSAATNIKRSTGVNVMVKFARGARSQTSGVALIEGLDLFPLPTPILTISIHSIKYNRASGLLEVTYKSDSNAPGYLKGTFTIISDGQSIRVGDIEPIFISPGDFKTIMYSINLSSIENLEADIYVIFGETVLSLDRVLRGRVNVSVINVIDACKFTKEDIKSIKYNKQKKSFVIKIKNSNPIDCWIDIELNDIWIGYIQNTLSTSNSILIKSGKTKEIIIEEELDSDDLEKNSLLKMTLFSGEREDSLVNRLIIDKIKLSIVALSLITYVIIGLVVVIVLLIVIILIIKKRNDNED
ncbi:hypothetical protein GOV12_06515 [Candidatus Pacearchaeota archaeon]|nr:hypothetical protein [Candidatus Pacearchaeota archaeon]